MLSNFREILMREVLRARTLRFGLSVEAWPEGTSAEAMLNEHPAFEIGP
jgi:hypothetical protein